MTPLAPTTPAGLPLPFDHHDTEDPAELACLVEKWEAAHGPHTHVMMRLEPGIIYAPRPVSSLLILRKQTVFAPGNIDRTAIVPVSRQLVERFGHPVESLPFLSWCLVPLVCATNVPQDLWRAVPARKVGATSLLQVRDA